MQLNKTTARALAASVALVAAGGTVAGAAVFHLPILGFASADAGTTSNLAAVARPVAAVHVAPRRVVKTRTVDVIVHGHRAASSARSSGAAPTYAPAAPMVTSPMTAPPTYEPRTTEPPTDESPEIEPPDDGGHDHEGPDRGDDGAWQGTPTTTTTTTVPGQ